MAKCIDCGGKCSRAAKRCMGCSVAYRKTEEYRRRQKESTQQRWQDDSFRETHSRAMSKPSVRDKISKAACRQWSNPETRKVIELAIAESLEGRTDSIKAYWASEENRQAHSERMNNPETRRLLSQAAQRQWEDEEYSLAFSNRIKERWSNGAYDNRSGPSHVSNLETKVIDAIEALGYTCIRQYRPDGCSFVFDAYMPEIDTLVEVDGTFWHHSEWAKEKGQPERDRRKDEWAKEHGLDMHRIPESLFERMSIENYVKGWRST